MPSSTQIVNTMESPFPPLDLSSMQPNFHQAALEYDALLQRLTFNSKDIITNLTRVAGENMGACSAIASTIQQRSFQVPPLLKLPFLYLMDSIIKNIGGDYIPCFASNLFQSFTLAYSVVPPPVRLSMNRLLSTWPPYFGLDLVSAIHRAVAQHQPPQQPQIHPNPQSLSQNMPMPTAIPSTIAHNTQVAPNATGIGMGGGVPGAGPPASLLLRSMLPSRPATAGFSRGQAAGGGGLLGPQHVNGMSVPPTSNAPGFGLNMSNMMGLRSQPTASGSFGVGLGVASVVGAGVAPGPAVMTPEFLRTQQEVSEIMRKAGMGIRPTNRELFDVNRLITTQLSNSNTLPDHRATLQRFQNQLREAARLPANTNSNAIVSHINNVNPMRMPLQNQTQTQTQTLNRLPLQNTNMNQSQSMASPSIPPMKPMPLVPGGHVGQFVPNPNVPPPSSAPLSNANTNASGLLNSIGGTQALTGLLRSLPRGLLSSANGPPTSSAAMPMNASSTTGGIAAHPSVRPGLGGAGLRPGNQGPFHFQAMPSVRDMPDIPRREEPLFTGVLSTPLKFSELEGMSHASAVRALYVDLPHMSKGDGMRFAKKEQLRSHLDWVFQQNKRKRAVANRDSHGGHSRSWYTKAEVFVRQGLGLDNDGANGVGSGNEQSKALSGLFNNRNSNNYDRNNKKGLNAIGVSSRDGIGVGKYGFDPNKSTDSFSGLQPGQTASDPNKPSAVPVRGDSETCAACGETFETYWDDDCGSWMLSDAVRVDDGEVFHTKCLESTQAAAADSESEHSEEHVEEGPDTAVEGEGESELQQNSSQAEINEAQLAINDAQAVIKKESIAAGEEQSNTEKVESTTEETRESSEAQNKEELKGSNFVKTEVLVTIGGDANSVNVNTNTTTTANDTNIMNTDETNDKGNAPSETDLNKKRKLTDVTENTDSGLDLNESAAELAEQVQKKVKTEARPGEEEDKAMRIEEGASSDIKESET